jgi:putative ABC transport system permease protein
MFKFAPYILKTLSRQGVRTLLTVSGSAVALFVFCFVRSAQEGLDRLTTQNESTLVVFQANKFCPATSHLNEDYDRIIGKMEGVEDVMPIQVFTNNCRASLDVVVFYGVPPEKIRTFRDFKLTAGSWSNFEANQDSGIIGKALADRKGKGPGDKYTIGGVTVTVAGVFTSQQPAEESYVYTHLDFLQRARGLNSDGTVTQHEVLLANSAVPQVVADQIDDRFRRGPVETDTRPKGVFQASSLADLVDLIGLAEYLGYACLALMTMLISTTTFMAVQDRIKEHAVLQTLGYTSYGVFSLVLIESLLTSLVGGILGVGLVSQALQLSRLSVGAEAVSIAFSPSVQLAVTGIAVSAVIGLAAGFLPAWRASQADVVAALRES